MTYSNPVVDEQHKNLFFTMLILINLSYVYLVSSKIDYQLFKIFRLIHNFLQKR